MADTLIQGTTIIEDKRSGKGEILSIPGHAFKGTNPDTDSIAVTGVMFVSALIMGANGIKLVVPISLPNGVTIKKVIVYGSVSDETWRLTRAGLNGGTPESIMATANLNTEDQTIIDPTINNDDFSYTLACLNLDQNDVLNSARIIYEF